MATIIGKKKICEIRLADFGHEMIDGVPFYTRWNEFSNVAKRYLNDIAFEQCFAQPVEKDRSTIEWFIPSKIVPVESMADLKGTDPSQYNCLVDKRRGLVEYLQSAISNATPAARKFIEVLKQSLSGERADALCFVSAEGDLVVSYWGVQPKPGRDLSGVVRMDAVDHTIHTIRFFVTEGGTLSRQKISRKHGYTLGAGDVPEVSVSDGYAFVRWDPDAPHGKQVLSDMEFTAVCELREEGEAIINNPDDVKEEEPVRKNPLKHVEPQEPDNPMYNVVFRCTEGGILRGQTRYVKPRGHKIIASEIPIPEAKPGYRFDYWDKQPEGYIVNDDVEFVAVFSKLTDKEIYDEDVYYRGWHGSFWRSLLRWLFFGLLALLILLLLWCFLFGTCWRGNCGCDCDVVDTTKVDPTPNDKTTTDPNDTVTPVIGSCNTVSNAGHNNIDVRIVDMGQQGGTFIFEYNTYDKYGDEITVYDGNSTSAAKIWHYSGTTFDNRTATISFSGRYITVEVNPDPDGGTAWEYTAHCP